MIDNKKALFWVASVLIVIALIAIFSFYWRMSISQNAGQSPVISLSPGASPLVSSPTSSSPQGGPSALTSPVTDVIPRCRLSGEIVYDDGLFLHTNKEEFNYEDVYDPHDIIKWEISPSGEDFSIGPNRLSGLKAGSGSDYLTISFKGTTPKYKKYTLSASIDYILATPDGAKIFNAKCSDTTSLIIK